MPRGSKGKEIAFPMWLAGGSLAAIKEHVCENSGDKPGSVSGWILDWERGKQANWNPTIRE